MWEFQAFTKLSFVFGDKKLFTKFLSNVSNRIQDKDKGKIKTEMLEMRKKTYPVTSQLSENFNLKKGRGGLTDIEFVVQYLILCNPGLFKKYSGNNIIKNIMILVNQVSRLNELKKLIDNFSFMKTILIANQNIFNSTTAVISEDKTKLQILAHRMSFKSKEDFLLKLRATAKSNQTIYSKFLR